MRVGFVVGAFAIAIGAAVARVAFFDAGTAREVRMTNRQSTRTYDAAPAARFEARVIAVPANYLDTAMADDARRDEMEAVTALGQALDEASASALIATALGHAEVYVREEAIHLLAERDGAAALPTLQQALQDASSRVQDEAIRALTDIGDAAVPALGSVLTSSDASMRLNAVDALGQIGGADSARYIDEVAHDENVFVREAAAEWQAELAAENQNRQMKPSEGVLGR